MMLTPEQRQLLEILGSSADRRWYYVQDLGTRRWGTSGWERLEQLMDYGFVELREIAGSREYRISPLGRAKLEEEA